MSDISLLYLIGFYERESDYFLIYCLPVVRLVYLVYGYNWHASGFTCFFWAYYSLANMVKRLRASKP